MADLTANYPEGGITVSTEKNGEEGGHGGKSPFCAQHYAERSEIFSGNGPKQAKQLDGNRGHFQKISLRSAIELRSKKGRQDIFSHLKVSYLSSIGAQRTFDWNFIPTK